MWIFIVFIVLPVLCLAILYMIIKAAVREGILEADQRRRSLEAEIALFKAKQDIGESAHKTLCPKCEKNYPVEYWPKCPLCGFKDD